MSKNAAPTALVRIALDRIVESAHNPRKVYEPVALQQLADSLVAQGQITPITVREVERDDDIGFEIAAGHRRFRAAKLAGLTSLDAIVRVMTDEQFLEVMTVEQLQHADFTPYEEAVSYANLLRVLGTDVARVAARVNKERRYVADRLRLLNLSADALDLLEQGRITVEHATLLSGLTAEQQERVIYGGLFVRDAGLFDELQDDDDRWEISKKPVSVPELRQWINSHILLDLAAGITADLFPETVEAVKAAEDARRKHVFITHLRSLPADAKGGPRIMKPGSWKDAGRKPCEYTLLATVLIGPQRGASLHVCTATKKCETHWRDEIKAAVRQVSRPGSSAPSAGEEARRKEQEKREAEAKKAQVERERWVRHAPSIVEAIAERFGKLKVTPSLPVAKELLESVNDLQLRNTWEKPVKKHAPIGTTAESLLRHVLLRFELGSMWNEYQFQQNLPALAKRYGIDAKAMIAAAEKAEAKSAPKAPSKAVAKKKGASR